MIKRKKSKKKHHWWILWVMLLVVVGGGVAVWFLKDEPPVREIKDSYAILSEAEGLNAEVYSRKLYLETKNLYDSAMIVWKKENDKFIFFRRFEPVRVLAVKASKVGRQAIDRTIEVRRNFQEDLKEEIKSLRFEMAEFEKIFSKLPLPGDAKDKHTRGKLLLNEAEIAFEKKEYNIGKEKSHSASLLIRDSYKVARNVLDEYFKRLPQWQQELENAIARSDKSGSYLIVVEKIPHRCDLYYNGVKKYSYPAEFGKNWLGDKCCEGDYATPEGDYLVEKKLDGRSTRYHKALLINYPNKNDRENFARMKKAGTVSRNAKPGGLIEIHGDGGKGADWTNGCVALDNKNMDQLFKYVQKGTEILIIGASVPLEDALKEL